MNNTSAISPHTPSTLTPLPDTDSAGGGVFFLEDQSDIIYQKAREVENRLNAVSTLIKETRTELGLLILKNEIFKIPWCKMSHDMIHLWFLRREKEITQNQETL
jgi:hypothetical protein